MDPTAVEVWAAVLRRSPAAALWVQEFEMHGAAVPNLRAELEARGVFAGGQAGGRLVATPNQPWIHHVTTKVRAGAAAAQRPGVRVDNAIAARAGRGEAGGG